MYLSSCCLSACSSGRSPTGTSRHAKRAFVLRSRSWLQRFVRTRRLRYQMWPGPRACLLFD